MGAPGGHRIVGRYPFRRGCSGGGFLGRFCVLCIGRGSSGGREIQCNDDQCPAERALQFSV